MRPLESLKLLDLTRLLPGPWASHFMAELGASVTRVVRPGPVDPLDRLPPFDEQGRSRVASYLNGDKQSLSLDLNEAADRERLHQQLVTSDILLEGFRPGVMQRFGLAWSDLKDRYPELIYCSVTGYGSTGPYAQRAGHDINYLARSGVLSHSGPTGGPPPLLGIQVADLAGGSMHAIAGILSALVQRGRTGRGCHVQVSITAACQTLNALQLPAVAAGHPDPQPGTELLNGGGWYGIYRTRDGRYLSVGALEPKFRQALCRAIDKPDWIALAESQAPDDIRQFRDRLEQLLAGQDLRHWLAVFADQDACVEPVLSIAESLSDPAHQDPQGQPVPALSFSDR